MNKVNHSVAIGAYLRKLLMSLSFTQTALVIRRSSSYTPKHSASSDTWQQALKHNQHLHTTACCCKGLGCIHINTSMSLALYGFPYTSSSKHEFRQTRVCMYFNGGHSHTYEYGLPVNFTRMSSFCTGRVFIQLVESKLLVNSINIFYKNRGTYLTSELTSP